MMMRNLMEGLVLLMAIGWINAYSTVCNIDPASRYPAHFPGILPDLCLSEGNCYDSSQQFTWWCYKPDGSSVCNVAAGDRQACGSVGATAAQCEASGCCYDDSSPLKCFGRGVTTTTTTMTTTTTTTAPPTSTFSIQTFTTKVNYGGTDANIYVTFISKSGVSSPKIPLTASTTSSNPFESGQKDVFSVNIPNNGPIGSIKVESDNTGSSPDWALDKIVVIDSAGTSCTFSCACWFGNAKTDNLLVRTLTSSC